MLHADPPATWTDIRRAHLEQSEALEVEEAEERLVLALELERPSRYTFDLPDAGPVRTRRRRCRDCQPDDPCLVHGLALEAA